MEKLNKLLESLKDIPEEDPNCINIKPGFNNLLNTELDDKSIDRLWKFSKMFDTPFIADPTKLLKLTPSKR